MVVIPKKTLGQHWLQDKDVLKSIAKEADLNREDTVLEIGPGLGTLTRELLNNSKKVIAVEFDKDLAQKLPGQYPGKNLEVINQDILKFDLSVLPAGYKVVANIPYYITNKILNMLLESKNKPTTIVLLVQKEVAERLAAKDGNMSILAISAQIYSDVRLGPIVKKDFFYPPPKVDSQVVILETLKNPSIDISKQKDFFRLVKSGFASKRKKLRSSLSGGLRISKKEAVEILEKAKIDPDKRAESLSIVDWENLLKSSKHLLS